MATEKTFLSKSFQEFFDSEKSNGILLIICTLVSLLLSNSPVGRDYLNLWQMHAGGLSLEHWINDALMAIFFLLIGLELERELYSGELSNFRNALLPLVAAIGGIALPALIHFMLNSGTPTQAGFGIPMATDIAFALFRVMSMIPYLLGGVVMWVFMFKSGIHATIAGVMLAFAIPYSARDNDEKSPSYKLEHILHKPVAFVVLPLFALANTGILIGSDWMQRLFSANSVGIAAGLLVGKPLGVTFICFVAVACGICRLPSDLQWRHIFGAGVLGGIGFTMSIFITNLAFAGSVETVNASKMAILLASLIAGTTGFLWLKLVGQPAATGEHPPV